MTLFRLLLEAKRKNLLSISLDDFYLPFEERKTLRLQNPKYIFRGPPGTHDVASL
jgi:D-glycerate 3-kinase